MRSLLVLPALLSLGLVACSGDDQVCTGAGDCADLDYAGPETAPCSATGDGGYWTIEASYTRDAKGRITATDYTRLDDTGDADEYKVEVRYDGDTLTGIERRFQGPFDTMTSTWDLAADPITETVRYSDLRPTVTHTHGRDGFQLFPGDVGFIWASSAETLLSSTTTVADDPTNTTYRYQGSRASGEVVQTAENNGQTRTFRYDPQGRLISDESDGLATTWTYDGDRLARLVMRGGIAVDYVYDRAGNVAATYEERSTATVTTVYHYECTK